MIHRIGLVFIFLFSSIFSFSQAERIVEFGAVLSGGKTIINWTVGAGLTCQSVVAQRSLDSVNFKDVYVYPSICGSTLTEEKYTWIDANPIKYSLNFYRLKIENVDFTSIEIIDNNSRIEAGKLNIYPNPTKGITEFWFEKEENVRFRFQLYNSNGRIIYEADNLVDNLFTLDASFLDSGIYTVLILDEDDEPAYTAKLLVY